MAAVVVAPATAHGRAALAVVRLTGHPLDPVLVRVLRPFGAPLAHGQPRRVHLLSEGEPFDDGVALLRRGPGTYTGEDLCEVSLHGNPLLVQRFVDACVDAGARLAAPGEFTRRAVLSGRMDLVRAEAVDQLIRATATEGAALARAALTGSLSRRFEELRQPLLTAAAELEARLDWPADDLALEDDAAVSASLCTVAERCEVLAETYRGGHALVEGVKVAIVGPVNAGKSSLFNRLLGAERAIVHERPGTTRDVIEARVRLGPLDVTLYDTAGERQTDDPIEAMGLALGRRLVDDVGLLLVVVPADGEPHAIVEATADRGRILVANGIDRPQATVPQGFLGTSARTGAGCDALVARIVEAFACEPDDGLLIASARQRDLLLAVAKGARAGVAALPAAGPAVAAAMVTEAIEQIDALTGADTREAVLDAVFARFCIGK